jgi:hypothetical protein
MSTGGRRDRTGDVLEPDELAADERHRCWRGWLDPDADHPIPCARCKPWLVGRPRRPTQQEVNESEAINR